jgi:hypothetical protein
MLATEARSDQEPNDGITQAEGPLAAGFGYTGTLSDTQGSSDLDTYVFYAAPYQQLDIHVADNDPSSADNCLDVTLGDADNNALVEDTYDGSGCLSDGQSTDIQYTTGATASRYYLEFRCDSGPSFASDACETPTQYSLKMPPAPAIISGSSTEPPQQTGEPNENIGQAIGPLAGNVAYAGSIQTVNDEDWFTFVTASGARQIDIAFTQVDSGADAGGGADCNSVSAEVVDSSGQQAGGGTGSSLYLQTDEWSHVRFTSSSSKRYFVHLYESGCVGARYGFVIQPASALTSSLIQPPPAPRLTASNALKAFVGWITGRYPRAK